MCDLQKDVAGPPCVQPDTSPPFWGNDCSYIYAVASALFILGAVNPLPNMDLLVSPGNQDGSRVPGWMFFFLLFVFVLHFFGWDVKAGTTEMSWGMSMIISLTVCHIMPSVCVFSTYSPETLCHTCWKMLFLLSNGPFSGSTFVHSRGKMGISNTSIGSTPRPTFQ